MKNGWHIERCASQRTNWLIMITMQQYDLIRHLNEILKGVFLIFAHIAQTQTNHTDGPMQYARKNERKKVIVLCLRIVFASRTFGPFFRSERRQRRRRKEPNEMNAHQIDGPSSKIFIKINEIQWTYVLVYRLLNSFFDFWNLVIFSVSFIMCFLWREGICWPDFTDMRKKIVY